MTSESKIKLEHVILFYKFSLGILNFITVSKEGLPYYEQFSFLNHTATRNDLELSREEEQTGAKILEFVGVYLMINQLNTILEDEWGDGRLESTIPNVRNISQVVRLIRNAFSHDPMKPVWEIKASVKDQEFEIPGILKLRTHGLDGKRVDRFHYGGPLALLRLAEFIQKQI